MYETELYHRANFHADRCEISVLGQKYIFFLIGDSLGLPSHAIHFLEALIKPLLHLIIRHVML